MELRRRDQLIDKSGRVGWTYFFLSSGEKSEQEVFCSVKVAIVDQSRLKMAQAPW
jgi:hypothetical protein